MSERTPMIASFTLPLPIGRFKGTRRGAVGVAKSPSCSFCHSRTRLVGKSSRPAYSLVEVVVVIAIVGFLASLVIPAIQAARDAAARSASINQTRQIALAFLGFAAAHESRLPSLDGNQSSANRDYPMFHALLSYAGCETAWQRMQYGSKNYEVVRVQVYLNPADPTINTPSINKDLCSYAANAKVFMGDPRLPSSIPDGTSTTIALAEHYAIIPRADGKGSTEFNFAAGYASPVIPARLAGGGGLISRRASFADTECGDVVPVTKDGVTASSISGLTFQAKPIPTIARTSLAQSPLPGCMVVSFVDGSARTVSDRINERTFWSLVTPVGGERELAE